MLRQKQGAHMAKQRKITKSFENELATNQMGLVFACLCIVYFVYSVVSV